MPSLEPLEKQVTTIKKALEKFNARCDEISNQRAATAGNIHTTFRRLREILNVRETELIDQLDRMTQSKLKSLAAQMDEIETSLAKLNSSSGRALSQAMREMC
jgi:prefoldin subunit 5